MKIQGIRTLVFALVALVFLLAGLYMSLVFAEPGKVLFSAFAAAVCFIVAAVAGKSSVESLAGGGGIGGAWKALTTAARPEPPPEAK